MTISERKQYAMNLITREVTKAVEENKDVITLDRDDYNFDDGFLLVLEELGLLGVENEREVLHKLTRIISDKTDHYVVLQILEDVVRGIVIR